jgi:hypothetical protein
VDLKEVSEIVRNWATVIAMLCGSGWAFWKLYSEWGGARKNRASLDGDLSIQANALSEACSLVTVRGLWKNRGQFPVPLDVEETKVMVFELRKDLKVGAIDPDSKLGKPLFVQYPFRDLGLFELEPRTESSLRAHFVLRAGPIYLFRWELYKVRKPRDDVFYWSKEIVWNSIPKQSLQPDAPQVPRG